MPDTFKQRERRLHLLTEKKNAAETKLLKAKAVCEELNREFTYAQLEWEQEMYPERFNRVENYHE